MTDSSRQESVPLGLLLNMKSMCTACCITGGLCRPSSCTKACCVCSRCDSACCVVMCIQTPRIIEAKSDSRLSSSDVQSTSVSDTVAADVESTEVKVDMTHLQ